MTPYTGLAATRRGHGALILVVLIGIAIMLVMMFGNVGGTSYMKQVGQTRQSGKAMAQEISTRQLSILIAQHRVETGKLPATAADLDNEAAFKDPWGQVMTFTFTPGKGNAPTQVVYRSPGEDGETGTADDVSITDTLPY